MNEVEGAIAHNLVGDVHVARLRVSRLGDVDHVLSLNEQTQKRPISVRNGRFYVPQLRVGPARARKVT